jgi:hypothetical protein
MHTQLRMSARLMLQLMIIHRLMQQQEAAGSSVTLLNIKAHTDGDRALNRYHWQSSVNVNVALALLGTIQRTRAIRVQYYVDHQLRSRVYT